MPNSMRLRAFAAAAAAILLTAGPLTASAQSASAPAPNPAPLYKSANAVPGQYIVSLNESADPEQMTSQLALKPLFSYTKALRGFTVPLTPVQLKTLRSTAGVASVEQDARVSMPKPAAAGTRVPATSWGLDRIDQRSMPLDDNFAVKGTGKGATAYILDTGIDYGHSEFEGRAALGYDAAGDGMGGADCHGHGTHVAGTVGGKTFGVAREARLVSVRVLDCEGQGTWSSILAGLDWVATHAQQPAVLNASIGGDKSVAVNDAANAVWDSGVLPVVAAGNAAVDACDTSPASAKRVLTVGASSRTDAEADFSNYGDCLAMYAPGADIVSAQLGGGSVALSGTSMASPHVTGAALLYRASHPTADPGVVADWLDDQATEDALTSLGPSSPDEFLYVGGL
jgi:subtilisin family serine protease